MKTLSLLLQHLLDDHIANTKRINILSYVVDNPTFKNFCYRVKILLAFSCVSFILTNYFITS